MSAPRNLVRWLSAFAALFVLAVAIWTRNPALFIMVPLMAVSGYVATRKR